MILSWKSWERKEWAQDNFFWFGWITTVLSQMRSGDDNRIIQSVWYSMMIQKVWGEMMMMILSVFVSVPSDLLFPGYTTYVLIQVAYGSNQLQDDEESYDTMRRGDLKHTWWWWWWSRFSFSLFSYYEQSLWLLWISSKTSVELMDSEWFTLSLFLLSKRDL